MHLAGPQLNVSRDWVAWHRSYDDPVSSLHRRLLVVRHRIAESLDSVGDEPLGILSLCAGDGRDLLPELSSRPSLTTATTLVELDGDLAARAQARVRDAGLAGVEVRRGDAGDPSSFSDVLPVDLLLLCGIFGNVSDADIRSTIAAVPAMLAPGGVVVWTRGRRDDVDLRPAVRRWFVEAGLAEVAYDEESESFGVGVARAEQGSSPRALPTGRLFTFLH